MKLGAAPETPETLVLDIGDGAWLLTPEARVSIPALSAAVAGQEGDQIEIDELDISAAEHLLADTIESGPAID